MEDVHAAELVEFFCWDIVRVVKEVPQRKRKTSIRIGPLLRDHPDTEMENK